MKMIMRWFPEGDDSVTLSQLRQVPGLTGLCTMLPKIPVGEVWPIERITAMRDEIAGYGLEMEVIESVNIHEDIKKGLPTRDQYIDAYIKTLKNLGEAGIRCLCYNFMPVLDWARSDVSHPTAEGSQVMSYRHERMVAMNPAAMADEMIGRSRGYSQPGWEPERIKVMQRDIACFRKRRPDQYWQNMKYFLDAIIPVAEKADVKLAIHPDDPPWELFGLPKVINSAENIRRFLALNPSPYNGLTLCTGSLGAEQRNDIPAIVREFGAQGRIHFAHVRNVKHYAPKDFDESAHLSACGDMDMYEIMKAFYDTDFDGYMRPDHGRMIWGEQARPGYGLFDRALGLCYLEGLWEAIDKESRRG